MNNNYKFFSNISKTSLLWIVGIILLILGMALLLLVRQFSNPLPTTNQPVIVISTSTPNVYCQPYENVLNVYQSGNIIFVENISSSIIVARISWDGKDFFGDGAGDPDSFILALEPQKNFSQEIKDHQIADVWAWSNETGNCIDQSSIIITH